MLKLKRAGARLRQVAQPAFVAGTAYGCRVIGMAPAVLHRLRQTMQLALPDRAKSSSVTLRFMTSNKPRLDPTYGAWTAPLEFWARMAFSGDPEVHQCMQAVWLRQIPILGLCNGPWAKVAGPAGVTHSVLKELG